MRILIENIIEQLREVQEEKIWMGTNFEQKLDLIDDKEAFMRPLPDLHSVAEIISHLTAWRKDAILKIRTGKGSMTDDSAENWLPNSTLREIGWNNLRTDYRNSLSALIELLREKEDAFLKEKYYDTDFNGYYDYQFEGNP